VNLSRSIAAVLSLSAAALVAVSGQQPQAPGRFRSATTLVPIDVRVLDRSGKPITDLAERDFTVTENGVRQTISTFSATALSAASPDVPLLRAVGRTESLEPQSARVFMLLMGRGRVQGPSRGVTAMQDFVRDHLLPQDRVAVMAWNRATELSTDRTAILAVLEAFRKNHEKIERDLTEWFRDLRGQYGSREMPEHIQKQIDAVFAASTLRTRSRVDDPNGLSGLTAELRKTQDALDRAATAEGRPEGTSLMSALDAALLVGAEGSLNQFVSRNITMAQDLANLRAAIDYLRYLDGEKHVIFVTESGLQASSITGNGSIAAAANNARVVVDTIQSGGVSGEGLPSAATSPVLNPATGGATAPPPPPMTFNPGFAVKTINMLARDTGGVSSVYRYGAEAIKRIDNATRFGYLLGYYSSDPNYDKRYRNVTVTVNRPGVEVLYRHGYYATAASVALNSKDMADYSRMSRAAMSDADVLDLPLAFTTRAEGAAVTVDLNIRIDKLAPVETPQGKQYSLELAVFCANGKKIVGQLSKRLEVTLNPSLYQKMLANGLTASVSVPISGPATVVKVIVLDTATDSLGSVMKPIK
jgi:VWFA-related protein